MEHINGKLDIQLLDYTQNADRMLVFSKRTRHMKDAAAFAEVLAMSEAELLGNLKYVFSTIGSSLEFVHYTFLLSGVTRAFCLEKGTDVIVKHKFEKPINRNNTYFQGAKSIEKIKIGDEVLSYNEKTGTKEYDKVIFTSKQSTDKWYTVKFSNGNSVTMTEEHPVYVVGHDGKDCHPAWVQAKDLHIGDQAIQKHYMGFSNQLARGKTFEQRYSKKIANKIKAAIRKGNSRSFKERYGDRAWVEAMKRTQHLVGVSYEELHGKEKSEQLKTVRRAKAIKQHTDPAFRKHGSDALKKEWEENREKMIEHCRMAGAKSNANYFGKKSKPEAVLEKLLEEILPGEFSYNGDGSLGLIGVRRPDFINVNGKKKVIELFGCYWHGCKSCGYEENAKKYDHSIGADYKKVGFDCLVVWEHELGDIESLKVKIQTFLYNPGIEIVKVVEITKGKIWRECYNIETEKNHNFFANGILTHNTHQLVRHRVGVAFAQQAQRVATQEHFGYMVPDSIADQVDAAFEYQQCMEEIDMRYRNLLELHAPAQDARGVLPTNILTNILVKINLRALMDMLHVRLCIRAQGEFQTVARLMRDRVIEVHPWTAEHLGPNCLVMGVCKFPAYDSCPISQAHPQLRGLSEKCKTDIRQLWEKCQGYDPQPGIHDWKPEDWANHHDGVESKIFP